MAVVNRTLAEVAAEAGGFVTRVEGDAARIVSGASFDSRRVSVGDLFFCVPGRTADGHEFAATAADAGAVALCVERSLALGLPEVVVADVRAAMPLMAAAVYGHPADALGMVGVTGTNGKTTTVFLLDSIFRATGRGSGLIGTIETRVGDEARPGVRTTPESVDLQRLLREMVAADVARVAMEVTSHALVLNRVDGIRFSCATFTNLSQDHLDFHPDMEAYFEAKASLFTSDRCERAAVNLDDATGRRLAERVEVPMLGFGIGPEADVRAEAVDLGLEGSRFELVAPGGTVAIETALVGPFNVSNCLGAAASALQLGIPLDTIARGISDLRAVPGRFESIAAGQPFSVVVDYAHTPDSLDNALAAARSLAESNNGRVICVFGCGGDRDRTKRPLMGRAAAVRADLVIVTSDNPRSEDPEAIIAEIVPGITAIRPEGPDAALPDRREAIRRALRSARRGDVVVIAGKGHERGQEFRDRTIEFDDRDVARSELAALGSAEEVGG